MQQLRDRHEKACAELMEVGGGRSHQHRHSKQALEIMRVQERPPLTFLHHIMADTASARSERTRMPHLAVLRWTAASDLTASHPTPSDFDCI